MVTLNHPLGHQLEIDFLNPIENSGTPRNFSIPNDIYFLPEDIATRVAFTPDFSFDNESRQQINISNILVDDTIVGSEHTVTFNKNTIALTQEASVLFYLFIPEMALDDNFTFKGKEAEDRDWGTPIRFDNLKDLVGFYLENRQEIKSARKESNIREERREIGTKFYKENNNNVLLFPLDNGRYAIYPLHQTGRIKADGVINESGVTYINNLTDDIKEKLNQEFGGFSIYQMNNAKEPANIPLTPPLSTPASPIFDFGEKFGGAKKDYYSIFQHFGKYSNPELITSPLSQTLPHPNYRDLSKDGIASPTEIATLRYLRDKLNPKPSTTRPKFVINQWLESVDLYKNYYKSLYMDDYFEINGHPYSDVIFQSLSSSERKNIEHFAKTILALGFPEKNVNLSGYEIKQFNDKDFAICSNNLIIEKGLSWEQAIESLNKLIEKKEKTFKVDFFKSKADKTIFIGKRLPLQDIILADGFITIEDAAKYAKENLKQLEEKFNSMKLDPKERRESNRERTGKDYRNGKDISPEIFCQTFDFKGVEFGNWVQNKGRQTSLNKAYDSFMDLAHVTNIPTQAISLSGNLGIAFGSRGSGPYAAHYDPTKVVINLTKTRGAGSLAHEWWHALDNYFSRQKEKPFDYITENYKILPSNPQTYIRSELINAFKDITDSIRNSDLKSRSSNLDSTRTKLYWSQTRELTARCFENWIVDKLESNHIQNDYLANFRTPEEWTSNNLQTDRNYPYPTQIESEYINKNFQTLFDTIQTKLNNDNHTILFRESDVNPNADIRFNIIGEKGAQNNPDIQNNLDIAIVMEQSGKKPEEIFIATGWEKTNDNNQWKYDLHAEDIRFIAGISGTEHYGKNIFSDQLDRIIDYPALFKCYPQMRTMPVHFEQSEDPSNNGYYQNGEIFIETTGRDALTQLSTLIHEIQHAIQEIEGFAKGGNIEMFESEYNRKYQQMIFTSDIGKSNPKIEDIKSYYDKYKENYSFLNLEIVAKREGYSSIDELISSFNNTPSKQYYNLAGEVEARNASSRLNLPERERSMTMMSHTEDVAEPNKIYIHNRNEITTEIDKLSKILNTPVDKVTTRQELPDFIQKIMDPNLLYAGLYDIKNDKVYTILNEIKDVKEAQSTMLHEILGHKGLLALFKNTQEENEFFQKVWDIIPPAERSRLSAKYKDQKIGAEEYMARFAENYKEPKVWEKIEAIIKTFFRKLGIDLKLTSVDLKNILHKAHRSLQQTKIQPINQKIQPNTMNI